MDDLERDREQRDRDRGDREGDRVGDQEGEGTGRGTGPAPGPAKNSRNIYAPENVFQIRSVANDESSMVVLYPNVKTSK